MSKLKATLVSKSHFSARRRFGRWVANHCGLLVVPPEQLREWAHRATEYDRIAANYDRSDARLSGINDGRSHQLNTCYNDVRDHNPAW